MSIADRTDVTSLLERLLADRILIIDGAMGTMIQEHKFEEADFRGREFADHGRDLKGCNDLLCVTQPAAIEEIHRKYLEAGADIIETNSFNSNRLSMLNYGLENYCRELNQASAACARRAADWMTARTPDRPRFVAGSIGPTDRSASMSRNVDDPGERNVTYDQLVEAYTEQVAT